MAVSSGHRRGPPGPGRLEVEDRRVDAGRRLRPVTTGVDRPPGARLGHAVSRGDGVGARGDGLGRSPRESDSVPAGGWAAGDSRAHRPFRAHRTAGCGRRDGSRVPGIEMTTMLRHNKVDLALHRLTDGDGTPLLLLHGLGEASPRGLPPGRRAGRVPAAPRAFPGPVTRRFPRAAGTPG